MAEEQKKEESKPESQAAAPAAPATPAAAPATPDAQAAATATPAAAPAEKPKEEAKPRGKAARPSNCAVCNKSVKKTRWYYRNGKYYCTKTCWQAAIKKQEAPKEGAAPEAK